MVSKFPKKSPGEPMMFQPTSKYSDFQNTNTVIGREGVKNINSETPDNVAKINDGNLKFIPVKR